MIWYVKERSLIMSMNKAKFILRMEDMTGMEKRDICRMYNAFVIL